MVLHSSYWKSGSFPTFHADNNRKWMFIEAVTIVTGWSMLSMTACTAFLICSGVACGLWLSTGGENIPLPLDISRPGQFKKHFSNTKIEPSYNWGRWRGRCQEFFRPWRPYPDYCSQNLKFKLALFIFGHNMQTWLCYQLKSTVNIWICDKQKDFFF